MSVPIINRCEFWLGLCSPAPLAPAFCTQKEGRSKSSLPANGAVVVDMHGPHWTRRQSGFSVSQVKVTVPPIKSPHTGRRHEQS